MRTYHAEQREEAAAHRVASAFLGKLRGTYDVAEAIMFGSRARGDHKPDSDLDLAVVLKGRRGDFIDTKLDMAGVAFDVLMETGVLVQPFPMWDGDLTHPERFTNPNLIRNISEDGIRLGGYGSRSRANSSRQAVSSWDKSSCTSFQRTGAAISS